MRILFALMIILMAGPSLAQNRLAQEASLFLQQHADNPIEWKPWGADALRQARDEGKLIYVSVGYSSCHWCHVMEEENFQDAGIAAYMNAHFVSIMVDREQRPDLDEQFILITAMLTGRSGWPNGVFLTPEGDPFFGSGYMQRADFSKLLHTVVKAWQEDPAALRTEASSVSRKLRGYLDQAEQAAGISQEDILNITRSLLDGFDEFNGGFGEVQKFPQEQVLLLLLDQAERSGDTDLFEAAVISLQGMVRGGINDQVGGGFHRYATDPQWQMPHFEKMLYNQALIGRALVRAYLLNGDKNLERAATRTLDFVLREMQAPKGGFYAALDADSRASGGALKEGAFYTWTPKQIRAVLAPDVAGKFMSAFDITQNGPLDGASVLHMNGSAGETADETGVSPARLDAILDKLRQARALRPRPVRDEKIVLAWNAEMIATLAEAGWVLKRPDYRDAAERATRFIRQNMWPSKGLQRVFYQGRIGPDAQLADYAAYGRALLALYDFSPALADTNAMLRLHEAERLAIQMQRRFQDTGRPMRMRETPTALGPFRPLDDTELASGNALALMFLNALDRRTGQNPPRALKLAGLLSGPARVQPMQRAGLLLALAQEKGGESGAVRYSPGGAVRIMLSPGGQLGFDFRPGWHVNSHEPLDENLIATNVSISGVPLPSGAYPKPVIRTLGFSPDPLALYEIAFAVDLPGNGREILATVQACNDHICLPPADMLFRRW